MPDAPTPDPVSHAVAVVDAAAEQAERLAPRRRRLIRAFMDLDLLDAVGGRDWVRIGASGFEFGDLDSRHSDALTRRLEDLAAHVNHAGMITPSAMAFDANQQELPLTW